MNGYASTWWMSPDKSGDKADAGHIEQAKINLFNGRKNLPCPVDQGSWL